MSWPASARLPALLCLPYDGRPVPNVPHFDLVNPDYSISEASGYFNVPSQQSVSKYYGNGIYIQDQIKWGKVNALLAVRQSYYINVQNCKKSNESLVRQEKFITRSGNEAEIGKRMPNSPKHKGGIWAKYIFTVPSLNGLGIAAGANYISSRNTQSAILTLPSYVVADAAVYYTIDKFKISVNVNNVFNKTHWVGGYDYNRLFPGAPRNYLAGVGYTFRPQTIP